MLKSTVLIFSILFSVFVAAQEIKIANKSAVELTCMFGSEEWKNACKERTMGREFHLNALLTCSSIIKDPAIRLDCLSSIADKLYDPGTINLCDYKKTDALKLDCVRKSQSVSLPEYRAQLMSKDLEKIFDKYADEMSREQIINALQLALGLKGSPISRKLKVCEEKLKIKEENETIYGNLKRDAKPIERLQGDVKKNADALGK